MNLRDDILAEHSKAHTTLLTLRIVKDRKLVHELVQLFLNDDYRVVQRAARVMSNVAQQQPQLIHPYLAQIISRMGDAGIPVAVKRNVVRILQFIPIPAEQEETVMNFCFDFLADEKETVAVRAFSMTVLERITHRYPELRRELRLLIEDILQHREVTAGFRSRAKKTLSAIEAK